MGSGQINGIIATLTTSYKLGSLTQLRGTLTTDQAVGVSALLGGGAPKKSKARLPVGPSVQVITGSSVSVKSF